MPNLNLTSGSLIPGYWGVVDYNAGSSAQPPNLRTLLWAYAGAAATQPLNQPFRVTSQTDCNQRVGGSTTDAARIYAACVSQPQSQGADIWMELVAEPSGGVASIYSIKVILSAANPLKPGTIQLWVAGQQIPSVGFTTSDTATTIGAAIAAALQSMPTAPIASAINTSGTVAITYPHKGLTGEDFPVRCYIQPNGCGVSLSPGQLLFATNATGVGSVVVTFGAITVTTVLAGGETPAQVATKVVASFNASSYPLTAIVDAGSTSTVDLLFNAGGPNLYDVRRISAAIVTTTGLTVNLGSGVTNGAGSVASKTYNGTLGTGTPSLTQAITNLQNSPEFYRSWMTPFVDTTSLGTMATYLEAGQNGSITGQKFQTLTFADFQASSIDIAIPPAVSPNLNTTDPHYGFGWSPDAPCQAFELAARVAGARAAQWFSAPQFNWNGFKLQGNAQSPILAPAPTSVPDSGTLNTALRAGLSPWVLGRSGNIEILKGRTTSLAADLRLWAWSSEAQASYHVFDLNNFLAAKTQGASLIRYTTPKAAGQFDAASVADLCRERMRFWERNGNYDGADLFAPAVKASNDPINPFRVNLDWPESPVLDLDQIVHASHFSQPST